MNTKPLTVDGCTHLIICEICRVGVLPEGADRHLRKRHKIHQKQRPAIINAVFRDEAVAKADNAVIVPLSLSCPVPHVPVQEGFACAAVDGCEHVLGTAAGMKKHVRKRHSTFARAEDRPGYRTVRYQHIFRSGQLNRLVRIRGSASGATPSIQITEQLEQLRQQRDEKLEYESRTVHTGAVDEVDPWLERTQWIKYFEGSDIVGLLDLVAKPQDDEEELALIWNALDEVIRRAHQSVRAHDITIRLEVGKTYQDGPRQRQFMPYQSRKQLNDNALYLKRVVLGIVRAYQQPQRLPDLILEPHDCTAIQSILDAAQAAVEDGTYSTDEDGTSTADESAPNADLPANVDPWDKETRLRRLRQRYGVDVRPLRPLPMLCMQLVISLLRQKPSLLSYECSLVVMSGLLGVYDNGSFRPAQYYTSIISGLIKICRYVVVEWAIQETHQASSQDVLSKLSPFVTEYMLDHSHSAMSWWIQLRAYGMKIAGNTAAEAMVSWVGDTLTHGKVHFSMDAFCTMVRGLLARTHLALQRDVLLVQDINEEPLPPIPWHAIIDSASNSEIGYSFLHDPALAVGATWFQEQVSTHPRVQEAFITNGKLSPSKAETWLQKVDSFLGLLLVLIHITSGQPARGTEVLSIRYRNTRQGDIRNVVVYAGKICLITKYHKGYSRKGDTRLILRYPPPLVASLLTWYLWLALPWKQSLEALLYPQRTLVPAHIWPSTDWTSERFTRVLREQMQIGLQVSGVGIAVYRQLAIAIMKQKLQRYQVDLTDADDEDGLWDEDEEPGVRDSSFHHTLHEQAAHSSRVGNNAYSRDLRSVWGASKSALDRFFGASRAWQQVIGISSADAIMPSPSTPSARYKRWQQLQRADPDALLPRMLGRDDAVLRPAQQEAFGMLVQGYSPLLVIHATGSGKSLIFQLAAYAVSGGVTLLIVPLDALRADLIQRCNRIGIRASAFNPLHPPFGCSIVCVTPEGIQSDAFHSFLNQLNTEGALDRIVVDECHALVTSADFRPAFRVVQQLVDLEVPLLLLTATLPPSMESQLWHTLRLEPRAAKVLRSPTTRRNIAYAVHELSPGLRMVDLAQCIQQLRPLAPGRCIVYVMSTAQAVDLAAHLGCGAFFSQSQGQEQAMELLRAGEDGIIVATNSLGLGVDIPGVCLVVHVNASFTLLDYAQESGRGGRDVSTKSVALLLLPPARRRSQDTAMRAYEASTQCRRIQLDHFLDGVTRGCCGLGARAGEEQCDICDIDLHRRVAALAGVGVQSRQDTLELAVPESPGGRPTMQPLPRRDSSKPLGAKRPLSGNTRDVPRTGPARLYPTSSSVPAMERVQVDGVRMDLPPGQRAPLPTARDAGADMCTTAAFEQSQREYTQLATRRRAELAQDPERLPRIRAAMEWWSSACRGCGTMGAEHHKDCAARRCRSNVLWLKMGALLQEQKVKLPSHAACFWCHWPQALCAKWIHKSDGFGFQAAPGRPPCTMRIMPYEPLAVAMTCLPSLWAKRLASTGSPALDGTDPEAVLNYLTRKLRYGDDEMTRAVVEVDWFTPLLRDWFKHSRPV